ncbi:hypothetical protein SELMODRAFT_411519 [Selaginella moellendorffii]|uniref:Uncharacterized protein n=1 Tax=Selaginella moellendorffii TaxID=88036 RepID=D8RI72_SELML|nr:hypothetical protein SELMODRAFT_411519 [Selaginella moellendorffii]
MADAICGYAKRFQALDGDAKAWALDVYAQCDAMADFLFQVNKLELERDETLHALEQLQVDLDDKVVAPDERLEQDQEEAPSVNNDKLRWSRAGRTSQASSSGRQHFYADAWAIRPKLSKLFVDRDVYLKCFESAREDDDEPRDLTALIIEGVYFG